MEFQEDRSVKIIFLCNCSTDRLFCVLQRAGRDNRSPASTGKDSVGGISLYLLPGSFCTGADSFTGAGFFSSVTVRDSLPVLLVASFSVTASATGLDSFFKSSGVSDSGVSMCFDWTVPERYCSTFCSGDTCKIHILLNDINTLYSFLRQYMTTVPLWIWFGRVLTDNGIKPVGNNKTLVQEEDSSRQTWPFHP